MRGFEAVEGFVQGEQVDRVRRGAEGRPLAREGLLVQPAAVLEAALAAGLVDEDAAHGLGRGGEEVAPAVPGPGLPAVHQPR